jgi:prepilin-type N-terminal cleavage/methylation domain-containing protein
MTSSVPRRRLPFEHTAPFFSGRSPLAGPPTVPVGFTLLELLVVLALIAGLLALAFPAFASIHQRSRVARARADLAIISQALEDYRRYFGDFPQTGDFPQAPPDCTVGLTPSNAQAKLFNALTGVFGPVGFSVSEQINGRAFIEPTRLSLEAGLSSAFLAVSGSPLHKSEENTCFLDPWGRRYLYYYKRGGNPTAWAAASSVLYSSGPDGLDLPPNPDSGLPVASAAAAAANADNIYASDLSR